MFKEIKENNLYKRLINGNWESSKDTIKIYSPIDNSFIGEVVAMTKAELNDAITTAKNSQNLWKSMPMHERAKILIKAAENLLNHKDEIATIITKEIAKDFKSCMSEVERTADLIIETVHEAKRLNGEVLSGEGMGPDVATKIAIVKRVPLGTILAISPFNYPINLSASKIAPALIMGNTVLFKPATQGSISATLFARALDAAGLPPGTLNTITGKGSVIGPDLIPNENINMINFTGSTEVGEKISKDSGMIPVVMELGGKDSAIVLEDADLDKAADQIVKGAFSYSGQRCTAIKRVLVMKSVKEPLIKLIKSKTDELTVGDPFQNCTVTPLISQKAADFVEDLLNDALAKGAVSLSSEFRKNNLIYPTIVNNVTESMKLYHEEPFGPILPIITISSIEEAISINNSSKYGLQSSIFSKNIDNIIYLANKLEAGTININGKTERGPDNFPFLGIKKSGIGVQGIKYALIACTNLKSIVMNNF